MVDKIFRDPIVVARSADNVRRLLRIMDTALNNNPYERPVMAVPPTLAVSASADGTLTSVALASGGALTSAGLNRVAWYGGVPTTSSSIYVGLPVASILPTATGGNFANTDTNSWAGAAETMSDAQVIEFIVFTTSAKKVMFQVEGQYVNLTGDAGTGAAADNFYKLTFASRKARRIRVLLPTLPGNGPAMLKSIRHVVSTSSFWKPDQASVIRAGFGMDSYGEGTNGAATIYPIPNAAWPVITAELLGWRDCRQLAVGSTGYISDFAGARSKLRDQIPRWAAQAPFDVFVIGHGYNDSANTPAAIQAEALACYQLLRSTYPDVPIVVLGCQAGSAGPNAAQIACEGAISAAVTAFNDPLCKFAPVSTDTPTWFNGTGKLGTTNGTGNSDFYVDPDGAHPSLAGADYLAFRAAAGIRNAIASMR